MLSGEDLSKTPLFQACCMRQARFCSLGACLYRLSLLVKGFGEHLVVEGPLEQAPSFMVMVGGRREDLRLQF